jgi:predicted transcriptional regulator
VIVTSHYGPTFDKQLDGGRLKHQQERIRDWMLTQNDWKTLAEIHEALGYPESSISAQLRHLRKRQFGGYRVEKRRRSGKGTWEYRVLPPEKLVDVSLVDEPTVRSAA